MRSRRVAVVVFAVAFCANAAFAYRIAVWIPGWDPNALTSTQTHAGLLSESNPTWYNFNSDGSLAKKATAEDPTWRAAMTGTALMPTIQNTTASGFNATVALNVLSTAATRETHAQAIRQLVAVQGYDGVDIDYENLPFSARGNFTAFIQLLASKLHADGKRLSVTVYAKTADSEQWDGAGGEDFAAIGAVADWVKLMVYDYSWSTSAPGPITPLSWLDSCVGFAVSQMPASKVMVGLPWYGYNWPSKGAAADLTFATGTSTAQTNGATIAYDVNGEATYTYPGHTVFFLDDNGHNKQIDLVTQKYPGVAGFAYWYIGSEDPKVWTKIQTLIGSAITPPPPPPPPAVTAPMAPSALASASASSTSIALTWLDNSTDEDGFRIERCFGAQATCDAAGIYSQVAQIAAGSTTFSDASLVAATAYTYRVRSYNSAGNSTYSNSAASTTATLVLPPANPVSGSTLVATGATWRYLDNGSDQGTAWRSNTFNDAAWKSGPAQLGYGDGDEKTVVGYGPSSSSKYTTTYFRYSFDLADPAAYGSLSVKMQRDDGAVVYLNGVEVFRSNMPAGTIASNTFALPASDDGATWFTASVPVSALVAGRNTVAVEVHQADGGSSDISFDFGMTGTLPPPAAPTGLQATAASQTGINLTWIDNSSNETGFYVERCTGAMATCTTFTQIAQVAANSTAYAATGLSAGTTYTFRVRAYSADGNSAYSPVAAATTIAPPPPPPPPPSTTSTLISFGSSWKYLDNGTDQSTAWRATTFADGAWKSGAGQLGYGDGDEKTVVSYGTNASAKYITTYFRQAFTVTNPAAFQSLLLRMIRDDGAVVYINGTEVWRSNMPTGVIGYKTASATGVAGTDESKIWENTISAAGLLVPGVNVIAVEIHQDQANSSDISFDMEMIGK